MARAVRLLEQSLEPYEVSGNVSHLMGNCLMRLGSYEQAAKAYETALSDTSYGHAGAIEVNRGRALLASGHAQDAIEALTSALEDSSYATPYKAQVALGNAYRQLGDFRNAGVAYRNAAIDESNPDPSGALRSLGGCFMRMGRAVDAVEAYRTALDFSTPLADQDGIYEELGIAYTAASRWEEAIDSFGHALASGTHELSSEGASCLASARAAIQSADNTSAGGTDAFIAAASGYATGIDPLDPTGETGSFMPSPDDTGFFDISEREIAQIDVSNRSLKRKHRHSGLRALLILLLLLVLVGGAAGACYYNGYGWPLQESVVEDLFTLHASGASVQDLLATSLSEEARVDIEKVLPEGATGVVIDGVDRAMSESSALATITLSAGGEQSYRVALVREGIGWKVAGVSVEYPALDGGVAELETDATGDESAAEASDAEDQTDKEAEKDAKAASADEKE
jgi:tetratricopeptide (TPR) repeat protein